MSAVMGAETRAPASFGSLPAALRGTWFVYRWELLKLRARVEEDIRAGTPPGTAATLRGRALLEPGNGLLMPPGRPRGSSP